MCPPARSSRPPTCWPRGRIAGLKTRAQESRKICNIPVFTSPRVFNANSISARTTNVNNLIPIPTRKPTEHSATGTHFIPSLMLSNPMSLVPKLSEVQELPLREKVQIGCIVESWLFLLMINDLSVPSIFDMWKYVDDTTVSETILKGSTQGKSREAVDVINHWSKENKFQLNSDKTKQLTISFGRDPPLP